MLKKTAAIEIKNNSAESINDLKRLKKQLRETAAGSEDFKVLYNQIDDLEEKIKGTKAASSDWIDSIASAPGPLGALGKGINAVKEGTVSFGGALKAAGIGIIVSTLGLLVAAFSQNEGAMKKLQPIMNAFQQVLGGVFKAIEPVFNMLVDLALKALPYVVKAIGTYMSYVVPFLQSLGDIGSALSKLLTGDFKGAWESAKSSVTSFSKRHDEAVKNFSKGTKEMTALEKEEAAKRKEELDKEAAKRKELRDKEIAAQKKSLEEAKQLAKQEFAEKTKQLNDLANLTESETTKAQQRLEDLRDNTEQKKLDRLKQRGQDEIDLLKQKGVDTTQIQAAFDEEYLIKQDALNKNKELQRQKDIQGIISSNVTEKSISDAKNLDELNTLYLHAQEKLKVKQAEDLQKAIDSGASEAQLNTIKEGFRQQDLTLEQQNSDAKKRISDIEQEDQKKKVAAIGETLQTAAQLLGEHTVAGKALAIAATTIDTFQSSVSAYKGMVAAIPGPFGVAAGAVAAAGAIASGMATVKKIVSVKVPGVSGGGSGAAVPSAPAKPSVSFQNTPQSQISDTIQNSTKERNSQPIKTYVTIGDINSTQSLNRQITEGAKFGN